MEERKDVLKDFIESYVTMKEVANPDVKVEYSFKNVIDMDIYELKCDTLFGKLNLEICHYLKNRKLSDGMTVKFRFDDYVDSNVKSRVRDAIFRKEVSNYSDKFGDTELVSLQIDKIEDFLEFFKLNVVDIDMPKRSVRSFIK